jgi:hypothetical protein
MSSLFPSHSTSFCFRAVRRFRGFSLVFAACALSSLVCGQTEPNPAPTETPPAGGGRIRRDQNGDGGGNGGRQNFSPEEIQKRMAAALREQFGVTDDEEWKLISDRISKVAELRRSTMGGFGGMRGGNRVGRQGASGNPEQDALRQAIADKLPDAEIKARLERLREARKANEEKLAKAQDELRAVLSVRQEAVAVMTGLLP